MGRAPAGRRTAREPGGADRRGTPRLRDRAPTRRRAGRHVRRRLLRGHCGRDPERFGDGEAWYVATALAQPGVDSVVRRILTRHGLLGQYAAHPAVETATRVAPDGTTRLLFLLNHAPEPAHLTAHTTATDLLTGKQFEQGQPLTLDPLGVVVLQ